MSRKTPIKTPDSLQADALFLFLKGMPGASSSRSEFLSLMKTLGHTPAASMNLTVKRIRAEAPLGTGQMEKVKERVESNRICKVFINADLDGTHQRNLQRCWQCEIFDRSAIILEIFARHARSYQSKLQVELAQLEYESSRLVRVWTHLERQRGALGQRGGPGEKQLETDRRLLRRRIGQLKAKLAKVIKQRSLSRRSRVAGDRPIIALVGYTNAGKSTLFNALTRAGVTASPKLFATLDPTIRKVREDFGHFLAIDTVGFIEDLSATLMEAFITALEEIRSADIILHVMDAADQNLGTKQESVQKTLEKLKLEDIPILAVYNKSDALDYPIKERIDSNEDKSPKAVWVSAQDKTGIELLIQTIESILAKKKVPIDEYA